MPQEKGSGNNPSTNTNNNSDDNTEKIEYNAKWKGYLCIILMSLVSFASISSIPEGEYSYQDNDTFGLEASFGSVTFALSVIILLFDRLSCCASRFGRFHKAYNGRLEGYILLFFVIWWSIGVGIITKVGGIAYIVMNVYYSSWLALAACVYTLDKWGKENDIISLHELTRLSATLTPWYNLWFWSLVEFASCVNFHRWGVEYGDRDQTSLGITAGLISWIISTMVILEHYRLIGCGKCYKHGGLIELGIAGILVLFWMVCLAILTDDTGIASTVAGTSPFIRIDEIPSNCTLVFYSTVVVNEETGETTEQKVEKECDLTPGSNLYWSIWFSFASSVLICFRWKASKALKFAEASQGINILKIPSSNKDSRDDDDDGDDDGSTRGNKEHSNKTNGAGEDDDYDYDDDDDDDDFEDAYERDDEAI